MASVGAQGRESLEQQLAKLKQYEQNVQSYKSNIEDLEHLNQEVQEAMIFENRHTSYTMEVSRAPGNTCTPTLLHDYVQCSNFVESLSGCVLCGCRLCELAGNSCSRQ